LFEEGADRSALFHRRRAKRGARPVRQPDTEPSAGSDWHDGIRSAFDVRL